jgi:hypothetical protein
MGLLYVCSIAGLIVVVGSLWLLWKGKIYFDKETGQVTEVELPFGFRVRTNIPAVVIFVLGAFLLVVPILKMPAESGRIRLAGRINSAEPLKVYAVAGERESTGDVALEVPLSNFDYEVSYWAKQGRVLVDKELVHLTGTERGDYPLKGPRPKIVWAPEMPLENLKPVSVEAKDVVANFK